MKRRIHSLFIVLAAAIMVFACGIFVNAETVIVESGKCGKNVEWYRDGQDTLVIYGTGDMYDYDSVYSPFLYHKSVSNKYVNDTWKLALIFLR